MTDAGALMAAEIAEQPEVLQRLLDEGAYEIVETGLAIAKRRPRFAMLAARGTSDHAALYAKYLLEVKAGMPCGLVSPSTTTVYRSRPELRDVLFIAVSQSGGSPDLIDSLTAARDCGAITVAVTNDPASGLADAAEHLVDLRAGVEQAVAATKTYTAELLALYQLTSPLWQGDPRPSTPSLIDAVRTTLDCDKHIEYIAARYRFTDRLITTARGFSYPTAREAALKLIETSCISAQAFSGADLLHGPLALVDETVPIVAVVTRGQGGNAMSPVLDRLHECHADLVVVGQQVPHATTIPVAENGLPEELVPLLEILPLQKLALSLALQRGRNPDAPRGLSKVTQTW